MSVNTWRLRGISLVLQLECINVHYTTWELYRSTKQDETLKFIPIGTRGDVGADDDTDTDESPSDTVDMTVNKIKQSYKL